MNKAVGEYAPPMDMVDCVDFLLGAEKPVDETPEERAMRLLVLETMGSWFEQSVRQAVAVNFSDFGQKMSEEPSSYEKKLFGHKVTKAREIIARALRSVNMVEDSVWSDYRAGQYAISEGCMVIQGVCIDISMCLISQGTEMRINNPEIYDPVLTHAVFSQMSLVPDETTESVLAIRPEPRGDRYVKRGTTMTGLVPFEVPADFAVREAIYANGVYNIVEPYTLESFKYEGRSYSGMPWYTTDTLPPMTTAHLGLSVLTTTKRYFVPTIPRAMATLSDRVWEVTLHADCNGSNKLLKLAPRVGAQAWPNYLGLMQATVTEAFFLAHIPTMVAKLHEVHSGPYVKHISIYGVSNTARVDIDGGYRIDLSRGYPYPVPVHEVKIPKWGDVVKVERDEAKQTYIYQTERGKKVESPNILTYKTAFDIRATYPYMIGVKAIGLDKNGSYVFSDAGKALDYVGGRVEDGETPMEGLLREIREELGLNLGPSSFVFLGVSDSYNGKGDLDYRSHIYAVKQSMLSTNKSIKWTRYSRDMAECVPWLPRYYDFCMAMGDWGMLYDLVEANSVTYRTASSKFMQPQAIRLFASVNSTKLYDLWGDITNWFARTGKMKYNVGMVRMVLRAMGYNDTVFFSAANVSKVRAAFVTDKTGLYSLRVCQQCSKYAYMCGCVQPAVRLD